MGELFPAEVAATEAVSFEKASHNHAKSDLIKDRDITRVLWRVFRDAGALDAESIWKVAELEISYSRCDFEAALDRANILIKNSKAPIAMYGRTMRMLIMVANGDADCAYKDFLKTYAVRDWRNGMMRSCSLLAWCAPSVWKTF